MRPPGAGELRILLNSIARKIGKSQAGAMGNTACVDSFSHVCAWPCLLDGGSMSMMRIQQRSSGAQHQSTHRTRIRWAHRARRAIGCWLALLLLASVATAQSTSLLNGRVTDPSGAA